MQSILEPRHDNKLLTTSDMCEKLGVCRKTLVEMEKAGDIPPAIRIRHRIKRWSESSINNWLAARESGEA